MDKVLKLADEISDYVKSSKLYIDYINAYNNIKDDNEIMERVDRLKRDHIDFAINCKNGNHDFAREKYISQEFYKVMLNKDVETYFLNEHKLVGLVNEIFNRITKDWELMVLDRR